MAENKHTAGPWFCEYGTDGYYGLYHSGDLPLDDNIAENERLIAAAPDLLAALIEMESEKSDYMTRNNLGDPAKEHTNKMARAAIARATQPGEV